MTVPDDLSALDKKPFADAVVRFEELLAQGGRAFLIGAGCSQCAGLPLTATLTQTVLGSTVLDQTTKGVVVTICTSFAGAGDPNIEDYLSELIDLLAIAERRTLRGATKRDVTLEGVDYGAASLQKAAAQLKEAIAQVIETKVSTDTHQDFVSLLKCVWVAAAPVLCLHSRGTASRSTRRASGSHRRDARSPAACC